MSHFSPLSSLPPDALLGLMTAYREDARAEKYDLGVGVYKDDNGHTPVLTAVSKAEARMLEVQTTKVYARRLRTLSSAQALRLAGKGAPCPSPRRAAAARSRWVSA
jgi:aspartate/tyrosine/aromatic aminotransferase